MIYDVDYFIKKFEAIPEEKWTAMEYQDIASRRCALGHCGEKYEPTIESRALRDVFWENSLCVSSVNDSETHYQQDNPRGRILAALYEIKGKQNDNSNRSS